LGKSSNFAGLIYPFCHDQSIVALKKITVAATHCVKVILFMNFKDALSMLPVTSGRLRN
jgi:hypothetical protein